jgi:hypothetical protein
MREVRFTSVNPTRRKEILYVEFYFRSDFKIHRSGISHGVRKIIRLTVEKAKICQKSPKTESAQQR